ncbi:MAG: TlpA disulfide reductase family protein [Myxococcota bacterium]
MPDAPKVKVEPISAQTMRVRMFAPHGKPRLVNFWATWCGPCVAELPRIRNWAEAHPGYEVVMVDLDLPNRREEAVVPFIEREGIGHFTHWQIVDPDPTMALGRILPDWPDQIPVTYVVSRQGTVTHRFARALTEADLAALK